MDGVHDDDGVDSVGSAGSALYEYDATGLEEEDPVGENFQQQLIADIEKRVKEVSS